MDQYLYRGVNAALYGLNAGKLMPKEPRMRPERSGKWGCYVHGGTAALGGDGVTWGTATLPTAAILHQRNSDHNPTAFVSTTPVLARARHYATHGGTLARGYVYKIDVNLLAANHVSRMDAADCARWPTFPEDKEVMLIAEDFGELPVGIVVECFEVTVASRSITTGRTMITQGIGKKIGRHYVVCGAMETTTRTFAPVFEIREGDTSFGKLIHEQRFPAPSPNFATRDEAFEGAADMGAKWIEANT